MVRVVLRLRLLSVRLAHGDVDSFRGPTSPLVLKAGLGRAGGLALGGAIEAAWAEGRLQPATVAPPGDALGGRLSVKTRSDDVAWVDAAAAPDDVARDVGSAINGLVAPSLPKPRMRSPISRRMRRRSSMGRMSISMAASVFPERRASRDPR